MRRTKASTTLILCSLLWMGAARQPADSRLADARAAWDRGEYPTALETYLSLLENEPSDDVADSIALQTGELYETTELTTDGGAPLFSPDGRYLTYETGRGLARRTRLARSGDPRVPLADLPGYGAAFSPAGGQVCYFKLTVTPQMQALERAVAEAPAPERPARAGELAQLAQTASVVVIHDLASGAERDLATPDLRKTVLAFAAGGTVLLTASAGGGPNQIYLLADAQAPRAITTGDADKILQEINSTGTVATFVERPQPGHGPGGTRFGVLYLPGGEVGFVDGFSPGFSGDGRTMAFVSAAGQRYQLMVAPSAAGGKASVVRTSAERMDDPALSRDGSHLVFQAMPEHDWELFAIARDGSGEQRLTREIQHDVAPRFLTDDRVLGLMGEPRHRRSYLYDLRTQQSIRLFHNNTVRTIAPEYSWTPSPDGTRLLIVAERDGDTVSPERGVYVMDLTRKVTRADLRGRVQRALAEEQALRSRGRRMFAPIAESVARVVGEASTSRIYAYEKALFDFDSKHITRPGNRLASAFLFDAYKSFGYAPEYQWFEPRGALGGQTANVVATLKGTLNPELVYVVSSHYDSVAIGPGADDDSSGTAALLETARILAAHPQPATIVFASFTGEESGLLGSREFVRRAAAGKLRIVGALNNDMIGWTNDHRLDDTIRYSNAGIRDVQHGAAIQFSTLITYDALYYKNTDAHAYYDAYGDIVGGIGSYPVLGSPHYHQPHDVLETINHQLVTEVAKTTAATLMLLASSPSRVTNLSVDSYENGSAALSWTPSPETGVTGYLVAWGPPGDPESQKINVSRPAVRIKVPRGSVILVKAVNQNGLEGWDWARVRVE